MFNRLVGRFMKEEKEAVKPKKVAKKKKEVVAVAKNEGMVIGALGPKDCNICIGKDNKTFLTIEPNGKMVFNKNDFPEWKVDNFAREFVNIVEEITGFKKI